MNLKRWIIYHECESNSNNNCITYFDLGCIGCASLVLSTSSIYNIANVQCTVKMSQITLTLQKIKLWSWIYFIYNMNRNRIQEVMRSVAHECYNWDNMISILFTSTENKIGMSTEHEIERRGIITRCDCESQTKCIIALLRNVLI